MPGVLCVMTSGISEMPVWSADSWDCPVQVISVNITVATVSLISRPGYEALGLNFAIMKLLHSSKVLVNPAC